MRARKAAERCRTCGRPVSRRAADGSEHYPFCSERCRLVDLSKWLNEEYRIAGELAPADGTEEAEE